MTLSSPRAPPSDTEGDGGDAAGPVEAADADARILSLLTERAARGEEYFRAKQIAGLVGLTPKQVGARLPRIAAQTPDLAISKWGRHRSTTWRVQPR